MRNLSLACLVLACFVATLFTTSAQTQRPADPQSPDKIVISKDEVVFDLIVRDKKGKPIRDLAQSDFDIYEDGVKQDISSFRFVSSTAARADATPAKDNSTSATPTDPKVASSPRGGNEEAVSAVALVFDRLSPESRLRARDAALSYVGESVKKSELVGVFVADLSLVVLQPFTYDSAQVKAGIEKAGTHATSLYTSNNAQARAERTIVTTNLMRQQQGQPRPEPNTESIAPASALLLRNLEFYEQMQRDQLGNATAYGLLHIAAALRSLPGRKAVIFFSEGLILPPNVMESFKSVINEANHANVSFYSVDVAGLRTESKTAETRMEINSRSELRSAQLGSSQDANGPMTKDLERNEDLLRLNPDSGLGQLASQTGGFLITDSNDLKGRLQQVDEDLHSYYLMSYSSSNQKYDGHFRKIEVKLKRSGLSVQSRKGYYAIKGNFGSPVLPYEVPALAVLDNKQKPNAFPFYAGAFNFPDREAIGLTPLIVDVPL
jgi:VWFA-related protein